MRAYRVVKISPPFTVKGVEAAIHFKYGFYRKDGEREALSRTSVVAAPGKPEEQRGFFGATERRLELGEEGGCKAPLFQVNSDGALEHVAPVEVHVEPLSALALIRVGE